MSAEMKTSAQIMTRVTAIGAVVDGLLGLFKIVIGLISQSRPGSRMVFIRFQILVPMCW